METKCTHTQEAIASPSNCDIGLEFASPVDVLADFLKLSDNPEVIYELLPKISSVRHIGLVVDDIDQCVLQLQKLYPERGYRLIAKFKSVGIPRDYEGSTGVIGQVKPDNNLFQSLELFSVNWDNKIKEMPAQQRNKLVAHYALETSTRRDFWDVFELLSHGNTIKQPEINYDSNELFGYLINKNGNKIEVVYHLQPGENMKALDKNAI